MTELQNKSQLIETLGGERAKWEAVLAEVGEARMTEPGVAGDWSVKDIIAHLTAWEKRPAAWLEAAQRGQRPQPAPWPRKLDEDQTNAWIYDANRDRPLSDVLQESRQMFQQIMDSIQALSEEALTQKREWLNNNSLCDSMPGNTYEHYRAHTPSIRAWLDKLNS